MEAISHSSSLSCISVIDIELESKPQQKRDFFMSEFSKDIRYLPVSVWKTYWRHALVSSTPLKMRFAQLLFCSIMWHMQKNVQSVIESFSSWGH